MHFTNVQLFIIIVIDQVLALTQNAIFVYPKCLNVCKNWIKFALCDCVVSLTEGRLYYVGPKKEEKREVVIDAQRKQQIFLECHFNDIGHHLGQKKTVHRIQTKYYWLGIVKDVVDWVGVGQRGIFSASFS